MCSEAECGRPVEIFSAGLCRRCYGRRRYHSGATPKPQQRIRRCTIPGCDTEGKCVRGMCKKHYTRWRKFGDALHFEGRTEPGTVRVETVEYRGRVYRRYPDSENPAHRRYFTCGRDFLHRDVYRDNHGPIPPGWHVHHMDDHVDNNHPSNLEALPVREHRAQHAEASRAYGRSPEAQAHLARIRDKAAEWHRSEAGREWHREHARKMGFGKVRRNASEGCTPQHTSGTLDT